MGNLPSHNSAQKPLDTQADHKGQSRKKPAWRDYPSSCSTLKQMLDSLSQGSHQREGERVYDVQTENGHYYQQVMAPFPELRTRKSLHAFCQTSNDFALLFYTKQGIGKTRHKRYLCLFTFTTAVHLEVAYGLDTNSFGILPNAVQTWPPKRCPFR